MHFQVIQVIIIILLYFSINDKILNSLHESADEGKWLLIDVFVAVY